MITNHIHASIIQLVSVIQVERSMDRMQAIDAARRDIQVKLNELIPEEIQNKVRSVRQQISKSLASEKITTFEKDVFHILNALDIS